MRRKLEIKTGEILPARAEVLQALGVPPSAPTDERINRLADDAIGLVEKLAAPLALMEPIPQEAFAPVYDGEGKNAPDTPLVRIFPRSSCLALFAVTIGARVSQRISDLFDHDEFSQGTALDAAASECVELAVQKVERSFRDEVRKGAAESVTMSYSPVYCGWDISAQRKLFAQLAPSEVGIQLNASCLMTPLKSVSGVLVAGEIGIFDHDDDFPFCNSCRTRECRARLEQLKLQ